MGENHRGVWFPQQDTVNGGAFETQQHGYFQIFFIFTFTTSDMQATFINILCCIL